MSDSTLRERVMESIYVVLPKLLALSGQDAPRLSDQTRLMEDLGISLGDHAGTHAGAGGSPGRPARRRGGPARRPGIPRQAG